jgi:hypothetical protein
MSFPEKESPEVLRWERKTAGSVVIAQFFTGGFIIWCLINLAQEKFPIPFLGSIFLGLAWLDVILHKTALKKVKSQSSPQREQSSLDPIAENP